MTTHIKRRYPTYSPGKHYRAQIGIADDGSRPWFRLGRMVDRHHYATQCRRADLIRDYYQRDLDRDGCWNEVGIEMGRQIAKGIERPIYLAGHHHIADPTEYLREYALWRDLYDGLPLAWDPRIDIEDAYDAAADDHAEQLKRYVMPARMRLDADLTDAIYGDPNAADVATLTQRRVELDQLAEDIHSNTLGSPHLAVYRRRPDATIHDALAWYRDVYIVANGPHDAAGKLTGSATNRQGLVDRIVEVTPDKPLRDWGSDDYDAAISYWEDRPDGAGGKRLAVKTCRNYCKEWRRIVVDALSPSKEWDWSADATIRDRGYNVKEYVQDHAISRKPSRKGWRLDECLILAESATTDWQRLALALGINCAFGAGEQGRLEVGNIIRGRHPDAIEWDCETSNSDTWISALRHKSREHGHWLLWPETAELLERWTNHVDAKGPEGIEGTPLLFVKDDGQPLYGTGSNAQSSYASRWRKVEAIARPELSRWLPFGALRDTLPNWCRQRGYSAEIVDGCLLNHADGGDKKHSLYGSYTDRPWGRAADMIRAIHDDWRPVLAVLVDKSAK